MEKMDGLMHGLVEGWMGRWTGMSEYMYGWACVDGQMLFG